MKTEATNFNIGRGLLGEKNFERESEATLSAKDFSCPVTGCLCFLIPLTS